MPWDTTENVADLWYKTSFKAWRHPSNTQGYLIFGGVHLYTWEITPAGQWVSMERYWRAYSASGTYAPYYISDYGTLGETLGGYVLISDIVISQQADILTWQRDKTGAYVLVVSDLTKRISITTGGITLGTNFNSACPVGAWLEIYNNSDSDQTIASSVTLRLAVSGTTGTRTLAGRGLAVLNKVGSSEWLIHGWGVT